MLCLLSCNSQLSLANLAIYILWGYMGRIGDSDWKPLLVVSRWGYRRVVALWCSFLNLDSLWPCGHSLNSEGLSEVPGKGDNEATNKKGKLSNDIPVLMVAIVWWQKKDLQCETAGSGHRAISGHWKTHFFHIAHRERLSLRVTNTTGTLCFTEPRPHPTFWPKKKKIYIYIYIY